MEGGKEFNKEKPQKLISDAELMELRMSRLLADLQKIQLELGDIFEKRRAAEAMKRKLMEEEGKISKKKESNLSVSKNVPAESGAKLREGLVGISETELSEKVKRELDEIIEFRRQTVGEIERARGEGDAGLVAKKEARLRWIDESIEKLKGNLELLTSERTSKFLNEIVKEVGSRGIE